MSFDYLIAYEDRSEVHTSRWTLSGVKTLAAGNTSADGWLWMQAVDTDDTIQVYLCNDPACASGSRVAGGTADISDIANGAEACALTEENSSGLTGSFYFESYTSDPAVVIPVLVALCVDADLDAEYINLADLPSGVYSSTTGMADYCAIATQKALLLASQMFKEELGGYGAPEHRYHTVASRSFPDYRRLAAPDQLKDAAVHWALMLAFGACHERASGTMYSELRDYHDTKREQAIGSWNLSFNTDPDSDEDADAAKSSGSVRVVRI